VAFLTKCFRKISPICTYSYACKVLLSNSMHVHKPLARAGMLTVERAQQKALLAVPSVERASKIDTLIVAC
jgi:hypothetical protein